MAEQQTVGRRTALGAVGTVAAVATGASTAGTADEPGSPGVERTGLYSGTVDRVVGGEHVVILVEAGDSTVGQHVVPAAEYPSLAEGDPVYLLILFGRVLAVWEVSGESATHA